jgi:putative spermidine/putrescine transport system ATP-binding protein
MQIELKQLHGMLDVTIVYVTHDQSEALTMSDRVAVFESGAVVQIGTPDALYNQPTSTFVANFIGENNTLDGVVERISAHSCQVTIGPGLIVTAVAVGDVRAGDPVQLTIRPECIAIASGDAPGETRLRARIDGRIYLGDHQRLLARLENGQILTVKVAPNIDLVMGAPMELTWSTRDCRAFSAEANENISQPGRT